ncbi:MAG: hypothetical protein H0W64_08085 [Gammaproteobacteria bacterium]|nr:hypothetical protein [Gammaproteobacteria bacterium]
MREIKIITLGILAILTLSSSIYASNLRGQAGDLAQGQQYYIDKDNGIASYFRTGKSGKVSFYCNFSSNGAKALLYPGKNFVGNMTGLLRDGYNGPYTWSLRNLHNEEGNVKVRLLTGSHAVVACKEVN